MIAGGARGPLGILAAVLVWSAGSVWVLANTLWPEPPWYVAASIVACGYATLAAISAWIAWRTADRRWALGLLVVLCLADLPLLVTPERTVEAAILRARQRTLEAPAPDEGAVATGAGGVARAAPAVEEPPSRARIAARWVWDSYGAADVHVVMYVFLGWAVGYVRRGPSVGAKAAVVGLAVAGEAMQALPHDRFVMWDDVGHNLLGGAIGFGTARLAHWRRASV